jgi:hypothetical protein
MIELGRQEDKVFRSRAAEDARERSAARRRQRPSLPAGPAAPATLTMSASEAADRAAAHASIGASHGYGHGVLPAPVGGLFAALGGAGMPADSDALSSALEEVASDDDDDMPAVMAAAAAVRPLSICLSLSLCLRASPSCPVVSSPLPSLSFHLEGGLCTARAPSWSPAALT